jgi:hypothetical protein
LLLAGCGYVGDPLPPSLQIPQRILDLQAQQRGDRIIIRFTLPALTTDNVGLRSLRSVDLRAGEGQIPVPSAKPGPVELEVASGDWIGKEIVFRVRSESPRGRWSEWSNEVTLAITKPLAPPANLRAAATAQGVELSWDSAASGFRVLRLAPGDPSPQVVAEPASPRFVDAAAEFGKRYEYSVEAREGASLSPRSQAVSITPVDTFPPAVPSGLEAVAGISSIELSWDPPAEADLAGYFVLRAAGEGRLQKTGERIAAPSYSDKDVRSGTSYRYAIVSVDTLGNESEPSATVAVTAP